MAFNLMNLMVKIGADTTQFEDGVKNTEKKSSQLAANLGKAVTAGVKVVAGASVAVIGAATTGITALTTQAVKAYGTYEQLIGGVEKIFGDASKDVVKNANNAYKSAGLSANEYMETVTGFSASLIQSLGGDTKKAVDMADTAIRDMSDNANTFGTDIKSIMNAYQGFAKDNYNMLDNLKLGYGGTKDEMARLIRDAMKLDNTFKVETQTVGKGKKAHEELAYSYADVVKAIHIVQSSLNITGTTAKEADKTIQGTASSLKSAWNNLIIGLGDVNQDLGPLIDNVVDTALKLVNNIKPVALQAVKGIADLIKGFAPVLEKELPPLIQEILPALTSAIISLMNALSQVLPSLIQTLLPPLLTAVTNVAMALLKALPSILSLVSSQLPEILKTVIPVLITILPDVILAVISIVSAIGKALADNINIIMDAIMNVIHVIVDQMLTPDNIKSFILATVQIILAIAGAIIKNTPEILGALAIVMSNILVALGESLPDILGMIVGFIVDLGKDVGNKLFDIFGTTFTDFEKKVKDGFSALGKIFVEGCVALVKPAVDLGIKIGNAISDLWKKVTSAFTTGLKFIKDTSANIISNVIDFVGKIIDKIKTLPQDALEIGKNLVKGLWDGISNMSKWIVEKVKGFGGTVLDGLKKFFKIQSPSKLFRDEIGKYLALGLGEGFDDGMDSVISGMKDSANNAVNGIADAINGQSFGLNLSSSMSTSNAVSGSPANMTLDAINALIDAKLSKLEFVVPVYIGGKKIDQQIVTANARNAVVSGGR